MQRMLNERASQLETEENITSEAHKRAAGSNHDSRHSRAAYNAPIDRKIDSNELNDLTVEYAAPPTF